MSEEWVGRKLHTHWRLTIAGFCGVFYPKLNYFEAHLMVSSRVVDLIKSTQDGHSV